MSLELVASSSPTFNPAAEAVHRIGNNLALLAALVRMQAASISKQDRLMTAAEVGVILGQLGQRLDTVARLHRLLAEGPEGSPIELAGYLREIAEAAVSPPWHGGRTELQFTCNPNWSVSPERTLSLGLLVGELVANAVKYAHPAGVPGKAKVDCHRTPDDTTVLEVSDDGVGLPEGLDPMKAGGVGFLMVRSLAQQLGATVEFHSDDLGLTVRIAMQREPIRGVPDQD